MVSSFWHVFFFLCRFHLNLIREWHHLIFRKYHNFSCQVNFINLNQDPKILNQIRLVLIYFVSFVRLLCLLVYSYCWDCIICFLVGILCLEICINYLINHNLGFIGCIARFINLVSSVVGSIGFVCAILIWVGLKNPSYRRLSCS